MARWIDISGQTFGWLKAVEFSHTSESKHAYWKCECLLCGSEKIVRMRSLKNGDTRSCGCVAGCADITGQIFGDLKAVRPIPWEKHNKSQVWLFECLACEKTCEKTHRNVTEDGATSCGCTYKKNTQNAYEALKYMYDTSVSSLKRGASVVNTSGAVGITWVKSKNIWRARIVFRGKLYELGYYKDFSEAVKVRKNAEQLTHEAFVEWYEKYKDNLDDAPDPPDGSELEKKFKL